MLKTAKVIQILAILAILIYLDILVRFTIPSLFNFSDNTLKSIIVILSILAVGDLIYAYFMPRLMIKGYKGYKKKSPPSEKQIFSILLVRVAMFEAIAIYGFVLDVLGSSLEIAAIFFAFAVFFLLITFPTKNKWNKLATMIEPLGDK